jgi:hypothetical protein
MKNNDIEKRTCPRFDFPVPVEIETSGEKNDKVHKGVVVNISLTGVGAYFFQPFEEGQNVTFKNSLPVECNTASVLWSRKIDSRLYITGLKFLDQVGHPLSPLRFF